MEMDVSIIENILPHRYPFLLIDRILSIEEGRAVGLKNVTLNEWFFQGHFPGKPIMPGVLILESMAQVGATMMMNLEGFSRCTPFLTSLNNVKFRRPVVPGDQLVIEVILLKMRRNIGKLKGTARVADQVVVEGEIGFSLVKNEEDQA